MEMESIADENHRTNLGNDHLSSRTFYNFLPSKRKVVLTATQTVVLFFLYASLYGILGEGALPGSEIFALLLLSVSAHIAGKLVSLVKLPPLIGMLIVGFLFRNLPFIPYYQDISIIWATALRAAAFVVILLKAGLGLDAEKLKSLRRIVFQLAFSPCIVETIVLGVSSHFLLNLPWAWAIMLGFVISAVSPAVVVPGLLSLQERSFGIRKGIPTLVIAAASVDDILAITGFTIMLSISLSAGDSLWVTILKGFLEPIGGLLYGVLFGSLFWLIPDSTSSSVGFAGMFLSKRLGVAGLGPMACLVLAFVASLGWKKDPQHLEQIERIIGVMWIILQPFLFSLIGAEVSVQNLQSNLGSTVLALLIGFTFRIITAAFASYGGGFNLKERLFIAVAWFPKATVQILTGAVLSIIMTAPIGAALIALLGPLLLSQDKPEQEDATEMDTTKNEYRNVN
ncbi:unnamed protein product [Larinioides sclopetarius]|uniref:Cation/H+ exchanger transmembrane domain-containing protein n=2 Tax=Larinioides sclopetarius TaxID=280406 RepID=A0AAV1YPZ7_9ARAC